MSFRRSKIPKFIPILSLLILLVLGPIVFSFLQNASGVEAAWVDDNFSYRNAIPITSHTAAENNVYITATIDTSASGQFQADCGDLRFTTVGGDILPYYIVSGCVSASTVVHVFFKSMPAGAQTIYYYYGNPSAANGFSSSDFSTQAANYAVGSIGSQEKGGAPVAYWKFDEGTGTTTNDSTSNSNTGTITGATWKSEDQCLSGKCLFFTSTNTVSIADPANGSLDFGTGNFTISAWIRTGISADNRNLIRKGAGDGSSGWRFGLSSGVPDVLIGDTATHTEGTLGSTSIADNKWHQMTVVFNRSGNAVGFVDGQQVGTLAISTVNLSVNNASAINIGNSFATFTGFLDDVKIYNYARTAAQIKSDFKSRGTTKGSSVSLSSRAGVEGSLSNGLVGYWKMDEVSGAGTTLADSSGNSNTGTAVLWGGGNTSTDSAHVAGKFGNSFSFDGGDDSVNLSSTVSLSGEFTVSMWFNKSNSTTLRTLLSKNVSGGPKIFFDATNQLGIRNVSTLTYKSMGYASSMDNSWHHLTVIRDSSNVVKSYLDGSNETTFHTESGTTIWEVIGRTPPDSQNWQGTIDEIRIYNRALSPREVRDLYAFAPGPIGYWPMEESTGNVNDASGNGNAGTATGTTSIQGKFGKSRNFDGSNDYLTTPTSSIYAISNAITLEGWIYPTTISGARNVISNSNPWDYRLYYAVNTLYMQVSLDNGNTGYHSIANVINPNTWQHVAGVFDGSTVKLFVNGVQVLSEAAVGSIQTPGSILKIGANGNSGEKFQGGLDEVKVYNYARTQKQIVEDMNAGHPVGGSPVGSQVGYWRFDEGYGTNTSNSGNGGATYNATLASSPNAPTWNNEGKYGKALNFDGSNDYATINTSLPTLTEGSISMWVKRTATTGTYQMLFTDSGSQFEMAWVNASTLTFYVNNVGVSTSTAASLNIWYHITGTFSETGNYQRIYVNGVLANSSTYPGDATTATRYFGSRAGSYPFAGSIDEIKVYNSALTSDEIQLDYNRGSAMVLGTSSDTSSLTGGSVASSAASALYCLPGSSDTCNSPVGEWNFEESSGASINDISGNGNTGTNTSTTWADGKLGRSLSFNGTSSTISMGDKFDSVFAGDFSTSLWFKTSTYTLTDWITYMVFKGNTGSPYFAIGITGNLDTGNQGKVQIRHNNDSVLGRSVGTFTDGRWHFVEVTRTGSQTKMYIDGQLNATFGDVTFVDSGGFNLGSSAAPGRYFSGSIDDVRIYNYARTPAQVAWDYNRGAPVGHWRMDECQGATAKDSSGNGNTGTITIGATGTQTAVGTCTTSGTAWFGGVTGKFNSSLNFDGTDDSVSMGDPASGILDFGTDNFSVFAWVKSSNQGTSQYIISKGSSWNSYVMYKQSTGKFRAQIKGNSIELNIGETIISDNTWHHVGMTINRQGLLSTYVDGSLKDTTSMSSISGETLSNSNSFLVGSSSNMFNGQIDDVRVYNYALTATQVKNLYNGGAAVKFAPSTGSP